MPVLGEIMDAVMPVIIDLLRDAVAAYYRKIVKMLLPLLISLIKPLLPLLQPILALLQPFIDLLMMIMSRGDSEYCRQIGKIITYIRVYQAVVRHLKLVADINRSV